jgi:class 3 adenylate cyclase
VDIKPNILCKKSQELKACGQLEHTQLNQQTQSAMNPSTQAPIGEICCVFTDITDSTSLWSYNEADMWKALEIHNNIIREGLTKFRGYEVKTLGDGFHIAFSNASSALRFCLSAQLSLHMAEWPPAIMEYYRNKAFFEETEMEITRKGISVRMGLHFGKPFAIERSTISQRLDFFGTMVNSASRVQAQAAGGEIAISDAFITELLRCRNLAGVRPDLTMTDDLRSRILSTEVSPEFWDVNFKREVVLKGVFDPVYITLISCRKC